MTNLNIPDLEYRTNGMFTTFLPVTPAGETVWITIAAKTDGTGKVLATQSKSVIAQLRRAGYSVRSGQKSAIDTDDLFAELLS